MKGLKEQNGGLQDDEPVTIGIDQSYAGFAITAMSLDCERYYSTCFKAPGSGVSRLVAIEDHLIDELGNYLTQSVAMEGYAFGSQMANMAGELGGTIKRVLFRYFSEPKAKYPLLVPPTSLKKYVAGKGTGVAKQHMLLAIYKKWNVEFRDDNMADAYGLARIATGKFSTAYEKEVLAKLADPKHRETP